MTPALASTGLDELWPLFHFRCYRLWPKLASSMLKFCMRKRSFQWYPDQSDWLNWAWNLHENAQIFEWKLRAKFAATTRSYSMVKIACLCDALWEIFELKASPVEGQSLQQKDRRRRKRKVEKKTKNNEKPKDVVHFLVQNFNFCTYPSKNLLKQDTSGNKRHAVMLEKPFWVDWS